MKPFAILTDVADPGASTAARDMTPNLLLLIVIGVLVAAGVYLVLERSLTRVLIGLVLIGNGVNLLFLVAGGATGGAPIVGMTAKDDMSDPLPQAMVLTAIVITLAMSAFLLAMAYRSWQLHGHDDVQDDIEDRRIARIAERRAKEEDGRSWLEEAAESAHDETESDDVPTSGPSSDGHGRVAASDADGPAGEGEGRA